MTPQRTIVVESMRALLLARFLVSVNSLSKAQITARSVKECLSHMVTKHGLAALIRTLSLTLPSGFVRCHLGH